MCPKDTAKYLQQTAIYFDGCSNQRKPKFYNYVHNINDSHMITDNKIILSSHYYVKITFDAENELQNLTDK